MIQIKGLDHVVIRAQDAEVMTEFYCDVLGRVPVTEHQIVLDKYSCNLVSHTHSGPSQNPNELALTTYCGLST